jgi:GT2 family glycosyltransferase
MALPRVSVIIVNWHSEDLLAQALAALNDQTLAPDRVVIVDNGSAREIPLDRYSKGPIAVLRMAKNEGFAAANNRAIRQETDSDWIALLNPDAIPEENWLKHLMDAAGRHPEASAFGSRQLMGEDHALIDGLGDVYHVSGAAWRAGHGQPNGPLAAEPREIFAPCAAAAIYKRAALLQAGGFDEDFFCYFEDVDLGFRLRLLGHKLMLAPAAIVYHLGGATSGGSRSDFSVYHGQRNLVWAYFKNMPWPYLWLYLFEHVLFNLASIVFFAFSGQGKVILSAKWNALLGLPKMIGKRRAIQSALRASPRQVRAAMARGWLAPYRRRTPGLTEA